MKNQSQPKTEIKESYIVKEKVIESPTVFTLHLELVNKKIPAYTAGQFITVYFPESGTPEGKAYSMSSAPIENFLNLTVKAMGEFSNRLCSLKVGDKVIGSLPYGYFYSELEDTNLIMIAAGIGVTPFRSIILNTLKNNPIRKMSLFYTARTYDDLIFKKEFDDLQKENKNFKVFYFITREKNNRSDIINQRIAITDLVGSSSARRIADREFMICGSISFVGEIWKGLRSAEVPEEMIYTEAFFSH